MSGSDLGRDDAVHLAGPGNLRFEAVFDAVSAEDPDGSEVSRLSAEELGTCYVFPVVPDDTPRDVGTARGLARFCFGPSQASSFRSLTGG